MNKLTVAIIDDNVSFCSELRESISQVPELNLTFVLNDGKYALSNIIRYRPQVLLLDYAMPEYNGFDILKDISELRSECKPYIIMMSQMNHELIIYKALISGVNDVIIKPVNADLVADKLKYIYKYHNSYRIGYSNSDIIEDKKSYNPQIYKLYENLSDDRTAEISERLNCLIREILIDYGISIKQLGFKYLLESVRHIYMKGNEEFSVTKELYPYIARLYHTSSGNIETSIRAAIKYAWEKKQAVAGDNNSIILASVAVKTLDRPSNTEFIKLVVHALTVETHRIFNNGGM